MSESVFGDLGVRINFKREEDFLVIKETLTRMGVASKKDKTLYQSCHILHKQGQYAILHFKELFVLDGKPSSLSEEDYARRNTIVKLLSEWNLIQVVEPDKLLGPLAPISKVKIVPFKDKPTWSLVAKYTVGQKKQDK